MAQYSRSERRKKDDAQLSHTPIRKESDRRIPKARTSKKIARGAKNGLSAIQKTIATVAAILSIIVASFTIYALTHKDSGKSDKDSTPSSSVVKSSDSNQSSSETQDSSSDANADQNQDGQTTDDQSQNQDQSQDANQTGDQSQGDQSQGNQNQQGDANSGTTGQSQRQPAGDAGQTAQ